MIDRRKGHFLSAFMFALVILVGLSSAVMVAGNSAESGQERRNVILFIGDGMGFAHVDAASSYRYGAFGRLVFETFPVRLAATTYAEGGSYDPDHLWADFDNFRRGATDSAAAATALATGRKSYGGAIAVVGSREDYEPVRTIVHAATDRGMRAGVVTNVQFAHATPAPFGAHNSHRSNYKEIAREMLLESSLDLIMGCGHPLFTNDARVRDEAENFDFVGGVDTWRALVTGRAGSTTDVAGTRERWRFIQDRSDFIAMADGPTPAMVCGVPMVATTLQQGRSGDRHAEPFEEPFNRNVPTLAEMTSAALNVLDRDGAGLFLMAEGGAIDWAGHSNQTGRMIEEMIDFADAVSAAVEWVEKNSSWDETLIIVTSDHETGYLTGPRSGPGDEGEPPLWNPVQNRGIAQVPGVEWHSGSHTNQLVPVYARGVGAGLLVDYADKTDPVHGAYLDNTDIARVMFEVVGEPLAP